MSSFRNINFVPLALEHLEVLQGWLQQPHVRAFWDDGDRTLEQVRAHYYSPDWDAVPFVITLAGRVAGYIQTYLVAVDGDYVQWRSPHGETWGLDLLLGDAGDTGRGFGPQIIAQFVRFWQHQRPAVRLLLIDPDIRNTRGIRAYEKAGFTRVGEYSGPDSHHLIMSLKILNAV